MSDVALFAGDRFYRSQFDIGQNSYTFFKNSSIYYADPGFPGGTPYSGTDAATVINNALTGMATTGGRLLNKAGLIPLTVPVLIPSKVEFAGEGIEKTIFQIPAGTLLPSYPNGWIRNSDFLNGNTDIYLHDFSIDGNRANRTNTNGQDDNNIYLNANNFGTGSNFTTRPNVQRVYSYNSLGQGMLFRYCQQGNFADLKGTNNGRQANDGGIWHNLYWIRCQKIQASRLEAWAAIEGSGVKFNGCSDVQATDINAYSNPKDGIEIGDIQTFSRLHLTNPICYLNGSSQNGGGGEGIDGNLTTGPHDVTIVGGVCSNNYHNGAVFNHCFKLSIAGTIFKNNSIGQAGWQGLRLSNCTEVTWSSGSAGDDQGVATQGYAFHADNSTKIRVQGVTMIGNTAAVPVDLGSGNSDIKINNCSGYNPQGVAAITVTASPFTYTNNDSVSEYVTIDGGTITTVAKNAITLYSFGGAAARCGVWLEPGEAVTVTYTVAPTMNKDRK